MNKVYRWGVLGAGRIAEKFCEALCFVEDAEVYAVASRNIENAKAYAQKFKASKSYDNYDELVKDKNVDIIYIATPHAFHFKQTMLCLQNNKHVLCEKPMSLSYAQTFEMLALAEKSNLFLMEGMWTSCMPFINKIISIIRDGIIGETKFVSADFGFAAPVDVNGRLFKKQMGGGSVMDVGIYPIFLATLIFGEPSAIKTVSKLTSTGVDEYANVVMQYPNGQSAQILSSVAFNTPLEAEIIGTKGRIKIDNPWFKATNFSILLNDGKTENFSRPHLSNGFEHEIKEVTHCLNNGLIESNKMPHEITLLLSKIMAEILQQAGVAY